MAHISALVAHTSTAIPRWLGVVFLLFIMQFVVQFLIFLYDCLYGFYHYFGLQELNLQSRYGAQSWIIITGASSGQGRRFAIEWAARGFHLLLIGSKRTERTVLYIQTYYPQVSVQWLIKDFGQAYQDDFFDGIEWAIDQLPGPVSVLINSVGHRVAWKPFHEMDPKHIRDTIATGTIVQARLMHMLLPRMLARTKQTGYRCLIITITAQCIYHNNFGMASAFPSTITVPYLTVYEPTNAWGYFNMNSILAEYGNQLDLMNVTPGAVTTENTHTALRDTFGAIDDTTFVRNLFRMMGHIQGETCGHWMHAIGIPLSNFFPWLRSIITRQTGEKLADAYMNQRVPKQY